MSERSISVLSPESAFARQRLAILGCLVVVLAILFVFRETALSMPDLWYRSETFSHGFLVVPIFLWLVWQKRKQIARVPIRPYWPGLLLVGVAGFVWLAGSLADVLMVMQFGLILMIQGAVLTILGLEISRALAFPLLFLFFAVPFGHELVPELMDRTADFTVLALQVTGVPVYREGNNFVIPSGQWSVVEACSGIRYLIASFMAGTLFAYLMYRSARRRVLFVGFAILVPIVANWLRAYMIVMIGHLSGNELAVGVDHLIYGWIFFGIVLFVMFSIGAWFREDAVEPRSGPGPIDAVVAVHGRPAWAALAALALAISWPSLASVLAATDGARAPVQLQIEGMGGWQPVALEPDGAWQPHFSGHRHELRQAFERGSERVVVDIRYYFAQAQGEELINAENVLVKTEDPKNPAWRGIARGTSELKLGDRITRVRTAKLAGRPGKIDVAWWYWIDGRTTTSDVIAKGLLAWSRLRLQGDDSAAVFLSTEASDRSGGDELLRQFAADMGGAIETALAAAQKGSR